MTRYCLKEDIETNMDKNKSRHLKQAFTPLDPDPITPVALWGSYVGVLLCRGAGQPWCQSAEELPTCIPHAPCTKDITGVLKVGKRSPDILDILICRMPGRVYVVLTFLRYTACIVVSYAGKCVCGACFQHRIAIVLPPEPIEKETGEKVELVWISLPSGLGGERAK